MSPRLHFTAKRVAYKLRLNLALCAFTMSGHKTKSSKAAGKLISAVQKEWGRELGETQADESELVMNNAHNLLQARTASNMLELLAEESIAEYLGVSWLRDRPNVIDAVRALELAIESERE